MIGDDKRNLIETLVEILDISELRSIVERVIKEKSTQLNRLQQLSFRLIDNRNSSSIKSPNDIIPQEEDTVGEAVYKILKGADKPLSNSEIRATYARMHNGNTIQANTVGNVLWKGKQDNIFQKVGSKGTRYTKWIYIEQNKDEDKETTLP